MRTIEPCQQLDAVVTVPGSKSLTQRALIAAALAEGESVLTSPLASEDTRYTSAALRAMGVVVVEEEPEVWRILGNGGRIQRPEKEIFLGNNGTATRFLTSVAALAAGTVRITGDARMAERPILPLMQALAGWGVAIRSLDDNGCPPLEITAGGIAGGRTILPEGKSSQYLSSLLLVAPYARQQAELAVEGEVYSRPYVRMTLAVMAAFGIAVQASAALNHFVIPRGVYRGHSYAVEGDASSASYFWAAAAITGGTVTVANIPSPSLQGDTVLVDILARMGCEVKKEAMGITVRGPKTLTAITVDMADCPDVVMTLAVVAAFAQGSTRIENIAHLRIKECDRLHVMASELAKLAVATEEGADYLVIHGCGGRPEQLHGAVIDTHNDHRIAMCFAVAGLLVPGIRIDNPACVGKSFPDFWERFARLCSGDLPSARR